MSMTTPTAGVALLVAPGEASAPFESALRHAEGRPIVVAPRDVSPGDAGGLLIAGQGPFAGPVPDVLSSAIDADLPVLGIGWGMQAINVALGGEYPVPVDARAAVDGDQGVRHPIFISLGGKISFTIAGSGWVSVVSNHTHGLRQAHVAPGILVSCYGEDQVVEAIEMVGRHWIIGVQWQAHLIEQQPKGFDSLLLALVERAAAT